MVTFLQSVFWLGVILFILSTLGLKNSPAFRALVSTIFVIVVVCLMFLMFGTVLKILLFLILVRYIYIKCV